MTKVLQPCRVSHRPFLGEGGHLTENNKVYCLEDNISIVFLRFCRGTPCPGPWGNLALY